MNSFDRNPTPQREVFLSGEGLDDRPNEGLRMGDGRGCDRTGVSLCDRTQ